VHISDHTRVAWESTLYGYTRIRKYLSLYLCLVHFQSDTRATPGSRAQGTHWQPWQPCDKARAFDHAADRLESHGEMCCTRDMEGGDPPARLTKDPRTNFGIGVARLKPCLNLAAPLSHSPSTESILHPRNKTLINSATCLRATRPGHPPPRYSLRQP
jgi:hypothetical protein